MSSTQTVNGFDIETLLIAESGRIGPDIYRRTVDSSVWLKLVKQDAWPDQMGETISVLTYERTLPDASQTWSDVGKTGDTKFCIPDATNIPVAQTLRTYGLVHTAVESDPICINDVRLSFKFREQLRNVYDNLVENVSHIWMNRFRDEYARMCKHKIVAGYDAVAGAPAIAEDSSAFPLPTGAVILNGDGEGAGISKLTQGLLDKLYLELLRDSAKGEGMKNGAQQFVLVTSAEASDDIIHEQGNVSGGTGYREDIHYAEPSELLKPLGVNRNFRGFYHVIDTQPRRFNATAGAWVAVPFYVEDTDTYNDATTPDGAKQGSQNRYKVNPDYQTAEFEDSFIFVREVFTALVPKPLGDAGSGVRFNPISYRGAFNWLNIQDRVENPDKSWGYFRGVLAHGSKPVSPQWGYAIRHRRCDAKYLLLDCDYAELSTS